MSAPAVAVVPQEIVSALLLQVGTQNDIVNSGLMFMVPALGTLLREPFLSLLTRPLTRNKHPRTHTLKFVAEEMNSTVVKMRAPWCALSSSTTGVFQTHDRSFVLYCLERVDTAAAATRAAEVKNEHDWTVTLVHRQTVQTIPLMEALGDATAQAFVDKDAFERRARRDYVTNWIDDRNRFPFCSSNLDLSPFCFLTCVPLRVSEHVQCVDFSGCRLLKSVAGLPASVQFVRFDDCTSLTSVAGLPASVTQVSFKCCTSLTSVAGLSSSVDIVDFSGCTSLTSVDGLPKRVFRADFRSCTRLRRILRRWGWEFGACPAMQVRTMMRSGVCEQLLARIGPDVALLVGCFATAGLNSSRRFNDHITTSTEVSRRYFRFISLLSARSNVKRVME